MIRVLTLLLLAGPLLALADDARPHLRAGAKLFAEGKFAEALEKFLAAEKADPKELSARYNAVTALAHGDPGGADKKLTEDFEAMAPDTSLRGMAAYNAGTAMLDQALDADRANQLMAKENELNSAIRWLRQSLLDASADYDAKNNLEIANRLRQKLEQQKQQQQNQQDNKDNQNKDQQQDQKQQQDQEKKEQDQQKDQQNQQQKENQNQNKPQQDQSQPQEQKQQEREISEATAKNLLQAAKDAEKRAMKMLREQQNRKNRKRPVDGRDW